jgi:hypothetical protein
MWFSRDWVKSCGASVARIADFLVPAPVFPIKDLPRPQDARLVPPDAGFEHGPNNM